MIKLHTCIKDVPELCAQSRPNKSLLRLLPLLIFGLVIFTINDIGYKQSDYDSRGQYYKEGSGLSLDL